MFNWPPLGCNRFLYYILIYLSLHRLELLGALSKTVQDACSFAVADVHLLTGIFSLKPTDLGVPYQVNVRVVGKMFKLFHFSISYQMNL